MGGRVEGVSKKRKPRKSTRDVDCASAITRDLARILNECDNVTEGYQLKKVANERGLKVNLIAATKAVQAFKTERANYNPQVDVKTGRRSRSSKPAKITFSPQEEMIYFKVLREHYAPLVAEFKVNKKTEPLMPHKIMALMKARGGCNLSEAYALRDLIKEKVLEPLVAERDQPSVTTATQQMNYLTM